MRHLARSFAASLLIAALLTRVSHAQPFPESERRKAEEARKKADEKATDEAYSRDEAQAGCQEDRRSVGKLAGTIPWRQ
jgi:hypothetical protein